MGCKNLREPVGSISRADNPRAKECREAGNYLKQLRWGHHNNPSRCRGTKGRWHGDLMDLRPKEELQKRGTEARELAMGTTELRLRSYKLEMQRCRTSSSGLSILRLGKTLL